MMRKTMTKKQKRLSELFLSFSTHHAGPALWVFVVLKLSELGPIASWSWWLVLSPIWVAGILGCILGAAGSLMYGSER